MSATYTQFRDALLIALARKTNREGRGNFGYDDVANEEGLPRNPAWVEMAALEFKDRGLVRDFSPLRGPRVGQLTGPGMAEAERLMGAEERTVELDHSSPEYQKATSALGAVTEAVRQSNEYASSEPEDREQRLAELQAGRELLKPKRVRVDALQTVLLTALTYLALKFSDATIGHLASEAVAALKMLIDSLL